MTYNKKIIRGIIPLEIRHLFWILIPKRHKINTLVLTQIKPVENVIKIPEKYQLKVVSWSDEVALKEFYEYSGSTAFKRKIPKRLNSKRCKGFAFFDNTNGKIAYLSWIIHDYNNYLKEFNVIAKNPHVFWESVLCLPEHRHQGLHERMEQELINYCASQGRMFFYMQIHETSVKGINYALSKGFKVLDKSYVITWLAFDVFRNLKCFLRNPFKKIPI